MQNLQNAALNFDVILNEKVIDNIIQHRTPHACMISIERVFKF